MKLIIICILPALIFICARSEAQQSIIYAEVEGEYVTLGEDQAFRNCGAMYIMEIELDQELMRWYQVDTGYAVFCLCHFDLSVTYGPLEPGNYTVEVYYTEIGSDDTTYSGTTTFAVSKKGDNCRSGIISQYQSECYSLGMTDNGNQEKAQLTIYPNPVKLGADVWITGACDDRSVLEIFSAGGDLIFRKLVDKSSNNGYLIKTGSVFPSKGSYLLRVSGNQSFNSKLIIQ